MPWGVAASAPAVRIALLRVWVVSIVLGYVLLLAVAWLRNAQVGYDGVLRPEPHEVGDRGFTVLEVEPGSPADRAGVAAGDFVAAVDGNPFVFDVHQTYHNRMAGAPGSLRIGDTSPGTVVRFTLESRLASPGLVLGLALASLLGMAMVGIGAGVALLRPRHMPAWLLLAFAVALAITTNDSLWHWSQARAEFAVAVDWLVAGMYVLGAAALLHLFLIFPAPGRLYGKMRGKIWLPYLPAVVPLASLPFDGFSGLGWRVTLLVTVALLVGALFTLEYTYRHPSTPLARAQLGWIRWGLGVGVAATVLDKVALVAVPTAVPAAVNTVVDAAWLTFPASLGLAVLRYRLFEVPRIVRASVTWGILAAVVLFAYLALVVVGGRFAAAALGPERAADPTVTILAALVVAALVHPLRLRLQRRLERHVYQRRFARQRVIELAAEFMLRPRRPDALTRFLSHDVPHGLALSHGWLAVPADRAPQFEVEPSALLPDVSLAASALLESIGGVEGPTLLARADDLDAYEAMPALSAETPGASTWYAAGARALAPVRAADGRILAVWFLGARRSGDLFEREDLGVFERLAAQTGVQLERELAPSPLAAEAPTLDVPAEDVLTPREQQVLSLLARGYSNRQIADELVIGVRTAETHVERILRKLGLDNRAQAIATYSVNRLLNRATPFDIRARP